MAANVTFNALKAVIADPKKLEKFKLVENNRNTEDFAAFVTVSVFSYAEAPENTHRFSKLLYLNSVTNADFSYFVEQLIEVRPANKSFRILPLMELYESLIEENWQALKLSRDALNETESYTKTGIANCEICETIAKFLKEYVVNKTHNLTL